MKTIISFILIIGCLYAMPICAADVSGYTVTGTVLDKMTGQPIEYANITIRQAKTDKFITGVVSGQTGCFKIELVTAAGDYYLTYSYIGYGTEKSEVFSLKGAARSINLGNLYLSVSAQQIDEVTVTGKRSTYIQNIDKKIFNVGSDLMSASGSMSDLMQNIPSVQVDMEGNVSLRGNENVEILINGKPSTLMNARTRADVLQQLPASDIERVEVITNPSAQYKPDGVSGIINIVMKKQRKAGFNGTLSANTGSQGRNNATASINYNTGRLNLFTNYSIRFDRRDRTVTDDRTMNDSVTHYLLQQTDSKAHPISHIVRAGMEWNINQNNTFQLNGGYNRRNFTREDYVTTTARDASQIVTAQSVRYRHDNEGVKQAEGGVVYTHTFGENHELTADYSYSMEEGLEDNAYTTTDLIASSLASRENTQIWQANYQHFFRLSYQRTFNDHLTLNLGYELDALKTDLNFHVQNFENNTFVPDANRTSDFTNYQSNHALYATLEVKSGKFGMLLGLRPEYMALKSHLFNLDSIVNNHYFMVYPTLHTSYQLNGLSELQFNYSLRVNRPEGDDLNPFPEYQNPLSLKAGNPYLKPERIHSIEAGYQWKEGSTTLLGTLYYRYVTNKLTTITKDLGNSVLLTTKENLNSSSSAGAELIMNTDMGKWITLNLSGNVYYDQIDAQRLGYGKNKNAIAWSAALNANFNVLKGVMLQLNSRYISSSLLPQGRREATFITNLGVKYDIPHTNVAVMGTVSDLFNTMKRVTTLDTPLLKQRVEQRRLPRFFYIGAMWNFGTNSHKKKAELNYDDSL
ncbi:MAG: TonB-dependent receptor [Oscillospiraceae bacterium]|nr:TonB-dependent receptor [Oscillospiraceae bacterium]